MCAGRGLPFLTVLLITGCDAPAEPPPHLRVVGGDAERGRQLIAEYGCGACHHIPGVAGAVGRMAPPLTDLAGRTVIAGSVPNTAGNLIAWLEDPPAIQPRTAMPAMGVSEAEARHMAAHLLTLGADQVRRQAAGPPLATVPVGAAERLAEGARATLREQGWVDREAGVARIPIERAMDLLVEGVRPAGRHVQDPNQQ